MIWHQYSHFFLFANADLESFVLYFLSVYTQYVFLIFELYLHLVIFHNFVSLFGSFKSLAGISINLNCDDDIVAKLFLERYLTVVDRILVAKLGILLL